MDLDDSGSLRRASSSPCLLASQHLPESLRPAPAAEPAPPPRRRRPTESVLATHFRRLDAGHDGFHRRSDLRALQGQARLDRSLRSLLGP
mgnify:CR=1 FL=1